MHHDTSNIQLDQGPLYLRSFISFPYQSTQQDVPVTAFTAGGPFSTKWDSNGTQFALYANGNPTPIYTDSTPSFDFPKGLQSTTTLVLEADNGQTKLYAYLTIIITNAVLTPDSITVSGSMINSNQLTVQQTLYTKANLAISGTLNLENNTSFKNIAVSLSSGPGIHLKHVNAGAVRATENSTINYLTVSDSISLNKASVAMTGGMHLIQQGLSFGETEVTAKTDGFAIIFVDPTHSGGAQDASGCITYNNQQYTVNGMHLVNFGVLKFGYCYVPIRANSKWKCSGSVIGGSGQTPVVSIYWIPLGGGTDSYEISAAAPELTSLPIQSSTSDSQISSEQWYMDFYQTLAKAMDKNPALAVTLAQQSASL
ncbi:hypothetical protein ACTJJB_30015 [Chitinophaga sp. 22536]|uniref:hypothetical protein n=1 Tax=unclassified Chitinophaga TaxID=2619133 RepID=UPI003F85C625